MKPDSVLYEIYKELGVDHIMRTAVVDEFISRELADLRTQIDCDADFELPPERHAA